MTKSALIAIAAGTLFAAACKKKDEAQPMMDKPAEAMKSDEASMKAEAKPADTAASPMMAGEKAAKVHCSGVNACKGHGACKSEANACAGKNGCKGHGWVEMTEDECKAKNGTVLATK